MNMKDIEVLREVQTIRGLAESTYLSFKSAATHYTKLHNLSLKELIDEAVQEQDKDINWKNQKLRQRLTEFRTHLSKEYSNGTISKYLTIIKNIYETFDVTPGKLPYLNKKQLKRYEPVGFKDLPTKEEIKEAINISDPLIKATILFITSGGFGKTETLNMTIQDFINATSDYHDETNIYRVIEQLKKQDCVVPSFRKILRQKTVKFYYNFCSPEATHAICSYLIKRKNIKSNEEKLFKRNKNYFSQDFQRINDTLGLGKVGAYRRFRPHMLRKFHASYLYAKNHVDEKDEKIGLDIDQIDALQGRSKEGTQAAYFMDNPDVLKKYYIRALPLITILKEYSDEEIDKKVEEKADKKVEIVTEQFQEELKVRDEKNRALGERVSKMEDLISQFQH